MAKLNRPSPPSTVVKKLQRPTTNSTIKKKSIDKSDPDWYWKQIEGGKDICFVCGKTLKGRPHKFIGYHKFSEEPLNRHEYCEPGSPRYVEKFGGYINESMKNVKPPEKEKSYVYTPTVGAERNRKNKKVKLKLKRKTK